MNDGWQMELTPTAKLFPKIVHMRILLLGVLNEELFARQANISLWKEVIMTWTIVLLD